ncbi:MAG: histidinol phosphate phosphatase, partial [Lautropia sp.]|nr:histidinol phosphate phosphatase [Lautropia sp.]
VVEAPRRGRKPKAEAAVEVKAPARRGRKPKAEAAVEVKAPARRGRKPKTLADAAPAQAAWPFPVGKRP